MTQEIRDLGRVLYVARMKEAWGEHWAVRDVWPPDDKAWRQYPHQPIAEVDLILVQARAALEWFHG
jgi:hypothetical protein